MSMHENTLCKAAFNDIFLDPNGYVQPCCFINENSNRLNIKDVDNLNDWFFNNKEITSLRENLSTNIKDNRCNICWKAEAEKKWTLRTSQEYNLQPPKAKLLHITGGRLCNLACRMCGPSLSSKIQTENRSWQDIKGLDHNYNWIDDTSNVAKIVELVNSHGIEQMQLQGGEPQLMKGFVDIITQIDSKKRSQIGLQVTTNASIFNEKFWAQAVKFQRVTAGISIDATGSRYDVIRYHGDWGTTEKNCIKILDYLWTNRIDPGPNPALNLNIVLQLANVDQCNAMNSFYEGLQKRFPGLAFQYCLAHINDLDAPNSAWDIKNLPLEILNSLPDIKTETQLAKQWREGINYAIENNGYNKNYKQQVLTREQHFLNVHGKNLWTERPDWFEIYNGSYNG
jgi:radical SAM protein with 4Fe4S-binding SPASM domain